ncbi:MAG: glycosyl transferase, partial [Mycobacterium sp.]
SQALAAAVTEVLASPRYAEAASRAGATAADVVDPVRVCHEALTPSA